MHVEKPSTTSAASTAFCATKVEGPGGMHLWLDGNGKITAGNGTLDNPKPNAFSLVQIKDCPQATASCKLACYVHNLEKFAPDTHRLYSHNSASIREILSDPGSTLGGEWGTQMAHVIAAHCAGGFRWHVSGDIWSYRYAEWIAYVASRSQDVRHWIYTRSFDYIEPLLDVATIHGGNLSVNLSCDKDNIESAKATAAETGFRLCYMCIDGSVPEGLPEGSVIFPDYPLRGGTERGAAWFGRLSRDYKSFVCPVDYHGKSEERRCGRCDRCMK